MARMCYLITNNGEPRETGNIAPYLDITLCHAETGKIWEHVCAIKSDPIVNKGEKLVETYAIDKDKIVHFSINGVRKTEASILEEIKTKKLTSSLNAIRAAYFDQYHETLFTPDMLERTKPEGFADLMKQLSPGRYDFGGNGPTQR